MGFDSAQVKEDAKEDGKKLLQKITQIFLNGHFEGIR